MRFFPLLLLLLTLSCSLEDRIERREDRLLGTWVIDRARFAENGDLFNDNVDGDFKGDLLDFFGDGTVNYESIDNRFFTGFWRIEALRDELDGENDVEFLLDAEFFFPDGRLAFTWLGQIDRLGNNDFNVTIQEPTGQLRLRLDRVQ